MFLLMLLLLLTVDALAEAPRYRLAPAYQYVAVEQTSERKYSGPYYSPENKRKRESQRYYYNYDEWRYRSYLHYHDCYQKKPSSDPKPMPPAPTVTPKPTPKVYRYYQ